ncbi:MAG: DUF4124 domain-containing protein [Nitrospinaceae bacterium]
MRIFVITVICLVLAAPASAGLYKWKDENGKTHFTDDPSRIPLDNRNKKDMKKIQSSKSKGVKNNLPSAAPAPARKHLGAKKEGSGNKAGVDKNRVKDLLRLNQKKHYGHN